MSVEKTRKSLAFLSFIVSYKCTNECKHCALQSSPQRDNVTIELADVKRYLEDITSQYTIHEVGFFGGEPLLNFSLLTNLIELVKKFGIHRVGLPTNGYWGKNEDVAQRFAQKLKEAGLNQIGFSADAFHQEFIPIESLERAITAVHAAGIDEIALVAKYLGSQAEGNPFDPRTDQILELLSRKFKFCQIIRSPVQVHGRAANQLTRYYPLKTNLSEKCEIYSLPMFMVDPKGWVFHQSCQRISIGNAKEKLLSEIIGNFNPRKHPLISKLVSKGGINNLLGMAVENGYKTQEGYVDKCHLCFSVLNFLSAYYPDMLGPAIRYQ